MRPPWRQVPGPRARNIGGGAWLHGLSAAGLLVLTLVAYVPFLGSGYAATDSLSLVETSRFTSLAQVAGQFTRPVMAGTRFEVGEVVYRPFVSFSFGLDYLVWGLNPFGYHLTNLALHVLAVASVWLLATRLGLRSWSSLAGAALFALHPPVVASVPVIARRDSVLPVVAMTAGAALLLAADQSHGRRRALLWLGSLDLMGVALLSKESAFAALFLLPPLVVSARLAGASRATGSRLLIPFFVLAVVVFAIRFYALDGQLGGPQDDTQLLPIDLYQYGQTLGVFTRLLAWPIAGIAPSTHEIWPRLAAFALLGLVVTLAWLPRRQAVIGLMGTLWVVVFVVFCMVFKIATVAWLAYFALVGVAVVFAAGLEGSLLRIRAPSAAALPRVMAALLLVGLSAYALASLSASPLVRRYDQWQIAGDVTERFTQALTACVADAPLATHVRVQSVPGVFDDGRVESNLLGATLIESYTVDSALRIAFPNRAITATIFGFETMRASAETLRFRCAPLPPDGVLLVTEY